MFQVRGEGRDGQGWGGKNVKGGQEPAVAPNKGSSDRPKAQYLYFVLRSCHL